MEGSTPVHPRFELVVVTARETMRNAVVDTGFTGGVGVPVGSFSRWGVSTLGKGGVTLADGKTGPDRPFALLTVKWLNEEIEIQAFEVSESDEVLIGMELLEGTRLELQSPYLTISPL
jgi:clan AA aspartic protease